MANVKANGKNSTLKLGIIDGAYLHAFGVCDDDTSYCDHAPPDRCQVRACKLWLAKHADKRKTMNRHENSYSLKHVVERSLRNRGVHRCISNGAFIAAAVELGYRCERIAGTPNARFNIKVVI